MSHDPVRLFYPTIKKECIKEKNLIGWSFVNPDNPVEMVDVIITWDLQENMIKKINAKGKKMKYFGKKIFN